MHTDFNHFHCYNKKYIWYIKLPLPPHSNSVTTLPSKTQHWC